MEGPIALCFPLFPPVSWKKCRIETVPKCNALNMAVVQISRETERVVWYIQLHYNVGTTHVFF